MTKFGRFRFSILHGFYTWFLQITALKVGAGRRWSIIGRASNRVRDRTIWSNPPNTAQFPKIRTIPQNSEKIVEIVIKKDISIDHHDFYTLLGEVLENLRFKTIEKSHTLH